MTEQVNISIPQSLYWRIRKLANVRKRPLYDVLEAVIILAESVLVPAADADTATSQEVSAYRTMHADLITRHAGEYTAIYQEQLIDYDRNELALLHRLEAQYPNEVVLMKQVRPLPEHELCFRSPRLIRNRL